MMMITPQIIWNQPINNFLTIKDEIFSSQGLMFYAEYLPCACRAIINIYVLQLREGTDCK